MIYFKGLIGAIVVWIIAWISKSKNYFIAGLVPLFPFFALIAHFSVYYQKGALELKETALFGMISLIAYFLYLLTFYFLLNKLKFFPAMFIGIIVWLITASILVFLWK